MTYDPTQALLIASYEEAGKQVAKAEQAYERAKARLAKMQAQKTEAASRLFTYNGLTKPQEAAE